MGPYRAILLLVGFKYHKIQAEYGNLVPLNNSLCFTVLPLFQLDDEPNLYIKSDDLHHFHPLNKWLLIGYQEMAEKS